MEKTLTTIKDALDTEGLTPQTAELILTEGLKRTHMLIGVISQTTETDYTVLFSKSDTVEIPAGTTYPLANTYCIFVTKTNSLQSFDHVAETEIRLHPCYTSFKLEAYIGCPIHLPDGTLYGTLNFSSPDPNKIPFTEETKDFIRQAAKLIGQHVT